MFFIKDDLKKRLVGGDEAKNVRRNDMFNNKQ